MFRRSGQADHCAKPQNTGTVRLTSGSAASSRSHCLWNINGVRYVHNSDHEFSGADRGEYLGSVTDGNITMRVFSVKGDESGRYIYALWDWDGAFYVQEN